MGNIKERLLLLKKIKELDQKKAEPVEVEPPKVVSAPQEVSAPKEINL